MAPVFIHIQTFIPIFCLFPYWRHPVKTRRSWHLKHLPNLPLISILIPLSNLGPQLYLSTILPQIQRFHHCLAQKSFQVPHAQISQPGSHDWPGFRHGEHNTVPLVCGMKCQRLCLHFYLTVKKFISTKKQTDLVSSTRVLGSISPVWQTRWMQHTLSGMRPCYFLYKVSSARLIFIKT